MTITPNIFCGIFSFSFNHSIPIETVTTNAILSQIGYMIETDEFCMMIRNNAQLTTPTKDDAMVSLVCAFMSLNISFRIVLKSENVARIIELLKKT